MQNFSSTVDLHTHSTASDGELTPVQLVAQAAEAGRKSAVEVVAGQLDLREMAINALHKYVGVVAHCSLDTYTGCVARARILARVGTVCPPSAAHRIKCLRPLIAVLCGQAC